MSEPRLILVGNPHVIHVGAHFYKCAMDSGWATSFLNSEEAFQGHTLTRRLNWWLRGRRPTHLREFSERVWQICREYGPNFLVSTGIAPISDEALQRIGALGVKRLNYLTDDPWNPHHKAPWFMRALPHYDHVFSPRRANLEDLRKLSCADVSFLPFAYSPTVHFADPPANEKERARFSSDVIFAGGADADRLHHIEALLGEGLHVALYGGYWERHSATRKYARGHADPATLRKAISGSKVALCLVRRANRDGHSMRTFEVAATGACMLTEDTEEHREIFGPEGEAVMYFATTAEMIQKLHLLLGNPELRNRLARVARGRIVNGPNTYADRLAAMLNLVSEPVA